jgi:hypothetical protein
MTLRNYLRLIILRLPKLISATYSAYALPLVSLPLLISLIYILFTISIKPRKDFKFNRY